MKYKLRDSEQLVLVDLLNGWMEREELLEIAIDRKVGRTQQQVGLLQSDELAGLADASSVLDEIVERWGQAGGKWQLRGRFGPIKADGQVTQSLRRTFDLVRTSSSERTVSRGSDAGFEALTSSFSSGFDSLQRQLGTQVETSQALVASVLDRADAASLIRLKESTEYQRLIMDLQMELTELRVQVALTEREPLIGPEVVAAVLPVLIQLGQAAVIKLGGPAASAAVEAPAEGPAGV